MATQRASRETSDVDSDALERCYRCERWFDPDDDIDSTVVADDAGALRCVCGDCAVTRENRRRRLALVQQWRRS